MWRRISKKEYHYVRGLEEEIVKFKLTEVLVWILIILIAVLFITRANQIHEEERMTARWTDEGLDEVFSTFVTMISRQGQTGEGLQEKKDIKERQEKRALERKRLNHVYLIFYIGECAAAASLYAYFVRRVCDWERIFLKKHLYVQRGVCVGKKEIRTRSRRIVTVNLVTEEGERMSDVNVPYPVDRKIECDTRLLVVSNQKERTPGEYERMKPDGIRLVHIEPDYNELEYSLRIYPYDKEEDGPACSAGEEPYVERY